MQRWPCIALSLLVTLSIGVFELPTSASDGNATAAPAKARALYYTIRPDFRRCAPPLCGGFWVQAVNRKDTRCADGSLQEECYVAHLDMHLSGVTTPQPSEWLYPLSSRLLRGTIVPLDQPPFPGLGVFVVSEIWQAATEVTPTGKFVRLYDSSSVCKTAPCPTFLEHLLNSRRQRYIHITDLSEVDASDAQLDAAYQAMQSDDGLLAAGKHFHFAGPAGQDLGFAARQFYFQVVSKSCQPTGCSSHVCADQAVFTTCEWRPEYACIRQQRCEIQPDNQCGWTPTPESEACFARLPEAAGAR
jgi:hypothetical protein